MVPCHEKAETPVKVCYKVMCYEILSKMSKERNVKIEGLVLLNVKNKTVSILIRPMKSEPVPLLFNVLLNKY